MVSAWDSQSGHPRFESRLANCRICPRPQFFLLPAGVFITFKQAKKTNKQTNKCFSSESLKKEGGRGGFYLSFTICLLLSIERSLFKSLYSPRDMLMIFGLTQICYILIHVLNNVIGFSTCAKLEACNFT